MTLKLPAPGN